jgi:hypothetical protein
MSFEGAREVKDWLFMNGWQMRLADVQKHFQEKPAELQIPPLRYAPVGMTKGRFALPAESGLWLKKPQIPPLRSG